MSYHNNQEINYNMSLAYIITGNLDVCKLEAVFDKLISRHEALRTRFGFSEGQLYQYIEAEVEFGVQVIKRKGRSIEEIVDKFIVPFDLGKAPLIRVGICKIESDQWLFIMDMHHIVGDATSQEILLREFAQLYDEEMLDPVEYQYRDYCLWHSSLLTEEEGRRQKDFWTNMYKKGVPSLRYPYMRYENKSEYKFNAEGDRKSVV